MERISVAPPFICKFFDYSPIINEFLKIWFFWNIFTDMQFIYKKDNQKLKDYENQEMLIVLNKFNTSWFSSCLTFWLFYFRKVDFWMCLRISSSCCGGVKIDFVLKTFCQILFLGVLWKCSFKKWYQENVFSNKLKIFHWMISYLDTSSFSCSVYLLFVCLNTFFLFVSFHSNFFFVFLVSSFYFCSIFSLLKFFFLGPIFC